MDYHVQVPLVLLLVVDHLFDDLLVGHAGRRGGRRRVRAIVAVALVEHVHQQLNGGEFLFYSRDSIPTKVLLKAISEHFMQLLWDATRHD